MTPVRVLVVDDEKPARERLRALLKSDSRIVLMKTCASAAEAIEATLDAERAGTRVHAAFLDVQMPEGDGFAVVRALARECGADAMPLVVFVTAYDEYALRAFEAHAVDYLLKPFSDERFAAALDRVVRQVRAGAAHSVLARMQQLLDATGVPAASTMTPAVRAAPLDRLVVKGPRRVRLLPVDQIAWIAADGMYVTLHTRDGATHLHRALLGSLEGLLDEQQFVRIHRSTMVNIDVVQELRHDAHGDLVAVLRDATVLRVGRRFRARLQSRLGQPL